MLSATKEGESEIPKFPLCTCRFWTMLRISLHRGGADLIMEALTTANWSKRITLFLWNAPPKIAALSLCRRSPNTTATSVSGPGSIKRRPCLVLGPIASIHRLELSGIFRNSQARDFHSRSSPVHGEPINKLSSRTFL